MGTSVHEDIQKDSPSEMITTNKNQTRARYLTGTSDLLNLPFVTQRKIYGKKYRARKQVFCKYRGKYNP